VTRLGALVADVRALGISAPVRAAYEGSKRVGLHSVIFDRLVPPRGPIPRSVPLLGPTDAVPTEAADRTMRAADRIMSGTVVVFNRQLEIGERPSWHSLLHAEGEWPVDAWWKIDIRSSSRRGDVKWTWELGRHRHLVTLARAAYIAPAETAYVARLDAHLRSWVEQNPPERGVHWYSNLEIALRAISWLQVLALAGDRLDPSVRGTMIRHLYHSGRHLAADLPYTLSTMRNNHLVGDGLGLVMLGRAFPDDAAAARWVRLGDRLITWQLARQVRPDGSMIEDSVSYHRFVLEMLAARVAIGGASGSLTESMLASARHLMRLGATAAPIPQYGDWDEGRVLTASGDPADLLGTVRLAAALGGTGGLRDWRLAHDEPAWYAGEGEPADLDGPVVDGADIGGGIARASRGDLTVWLKAGSAPSHNHADLSSVTIRIGRAWLIGDPGTGTYNGGIAIRDYFRTSIAHSVLRLDDEDQLVPYRAFRWMHRADGAVGPALQMEAVTLMWGAHGAYLRLPGKPRVTRVVMVSETAVTVGDWVEGPSRPYRLSLPLHPAVTWTGTGLVTPDGPSLQLDLPEEPTVSCGSRDPFDGWWSETYGSTTPATRLEFGGLTSGPIAWTVRTRDSGIAHVEDGVVVRDGLLHTIAFLTSGVELRATADGRTERRYLHFPR
jgi:hypothetical protein